MPAVYPKVLGYHLMEQIGMGSFSRVFRAENATRNHVAACKVILLTKDTTDAENARMSKEIRIHRAMKHGNVLAFLDAAVVDPWKCGRYVPGYYMLLEFAGGGDLFDKIAPDVGVADDVARHYFKELVAGLGYIHSEGVCHRDLKPENLLLDTDGTLKITDFGLAAVFMLRSNGKTRQRRLHSNCGTLPYVAPEVNCNPECNLPYSAEPVDAWGAGVVLYTLLAGNTPWDQPSRRSPEFNRYLSGAILTQSPWREFDREARDLICGLLTISPEDRLTLEQAARHPWLQRATTVGERGPTGLFSALTQSLRDTGDWDVATPPNSSPSGGADEEVAPDSQPRFTESLLTPDGRSLQHLTRFYASLAPQMLLPRVLLGLAELDFTCREERPNADRPSLLVSGRDEREELLGGRVEMEPFKYGDVAGTFCVMKRTEGNPISWRRLWRGLVQTACVHPHVLRKR